MNKKSVVVIKGRKLIGVYASVREAGAKLCITPSHISDVCLKKKGHKTVRGYRVYFENDNVCYKNKACGFTPLWYVSDRCEVIGNVFDNPELLKENKR